MPLPIQFRLDGPGSQDSSQRCPALHGASSPSIKQPGTTYQLKHFFISHVQKTDFSAFMHYPLQTSTRHSLDRILLCEFIADNDYHYF